MGNDNKPNNPVRCLDKNSSGQLFQQLYIVKNKTTDDYKTYLYRNSVVLLYPDYRYAQIQKYNPETKKYTVELLKEDETKNLIKGKECKTVELSEVIWELPSASTRVLYPYRDRWHSKIPDLSLKSYLDTEQAGIIWIILFVICFIITASVGEPFLLACIISLGESYSLYYLLFKKYAAMNDRTYDNKMILVGFVAPLLLMFVNFITTILIL